MEDWYILDCVGELLNELKAVSEDNARLETELVSSRRDLDAMLDLLRRKERQFTDERKILQKKNKELAEVFDLFAERRHKRTAYYSSDDVSTQTDDVIQMTAFVGGGQVRSVCVWVFSSQSFALLT